MSSIILFFIIALVIFLYIFRKKFQKNKAEKLKSPYTIDDQFNAEKRAREKEIDSLLSKIDPSGENHLSAQDRKRLDELSRK